MRVISFLVGAVAACLLTGLIVEHQICDTGTCAHTPLWEWVLLGLAAVAGLGYALWPRDWLDPPAR